MLKLCVLFQICILFFADFSLCGQVLKSYDTLDIKQFNYNDNIFYNCVFTFSVRIAYSQKNFVSAIDFDDDDMITEIPILTWEIDVPTVYQREELIPEYYFYDDGIMETISYDTLQSYLSYIN